MKPRPLIAVLAAFAAVGVAMLTPNARASDPVGFAIRDTGFRGGEPTVGILDDDEGTIAYQAFEQVITSKDEGLTWQRSTAVNDGLTLDPYLHVDVPSGRILSAADLVACQPIGISDDGGDTWTEYPVNSCLPLDHPQFGSGPWSNPAGKAFPRAFYYCSNDVVDSSCTVSADGGVTWGPKIPVFIGADPNGKRGVNARFYCDGVTGKPVGGPDGTIYLPRKHCGRPFIGVSHDDGITWQTHWVAQPAEAPGAIGDDPAVTTSPDGTVYFTWTGNDFRHYMSHSTDRGVTWSPAQLAAPEDVLSTTFALIATNRDGAVATAYIGTRDSELGPGEATPESRWHLFVSYSFDAASPNPTWTHIQVTPENDPIKIGCIPRQSGSCSASESLLDFNGIALTPDGRVAVSYTDSCLAGCTTQAQSNQSRSMLAIQTTGPTLGEGAP